MRKGRIGGVTSRKIRLFTSAWSDAPFTRNSRVECFVFSHARAQDNKGPSILGKLIGPSVCFWKIWLSLSRLSSPSVVGSARMYHR